MGECWNPFLTLLLPWRSLRLSSLLDGVPFRCPTSRAVSVTTVFRLRHAETTGAGAPASRSGRDPLCGTRIYLCLQYVPYISCPPLSVANAHGCQDRPHTNRACRCRTTKEPLSEKNANTQWSVPDPRFVVHEACVLVGRRGETFLAEERDDNRRPLTAFCIV